MSYEILLASDQLNQWLLTPENSVSRKSYTEKEYLKEKCNKKIVAKFLAKNEILLVWDVTKWLLTHRNNASSKRKSYTYFKDKIWHYLKEKICMHKKYMNI